MRSLKASIYSVLLVHVILSSSLSAMDIDKILELDIQLLNKMKHKAFFSLSASQYNQFETKFETLTSNAAVALLAHIIKHGRSPNPNALDNACLETQLHLISNVQTAALDLAEEKQKSVLENQFNTLFESASITLIKKALQKPDHSKEHAKDKT